MEGIHCTEGLWEAYGRQSLSQSTEQSTGSKVNASKPAAAAARLYIPMLPPTSTRIGGVLRFWLERARESSSITYSTERHSKQP